MKTNSRLKERSIEGPREQSTEAHGLGLARKVGEHNLDVATELPQDLPARAARGRQIVRVGDNGYAGKFARAFGYGLEDGHPFGADGQSIRGVFHVATGVDTAGIVLNSRAHFELRESGVSVFANSDSGGDK